MNQAVQPTPAASTYAETRRHELRKSRLVMIDGNLAMNSRTAEGGISSRVYDGGYWGFASAPDSGQGTNLEQVGRKARDNARTMARFGAADRVRPARRQLPRRARVRRPPPR